MGMMGWLVQTLISIGVIKTSLKLAGGEKGNLRDLYLGYPLFLRYLGASILYSLMVLAGTLLLIVPGIIWSIQFQFYGYLIVDQGLGPIEALKRSSAMTKGAKGDLFLYGLLALCIVLAGALCLFVGLFAAIPTVIIATAFVYRKLLAQP